MRIGIFGGSFNPPHIGHVNASKAAFQQCNLDILIVIPTGTPPHKALPENTPKSELRLQMTNNAFNSEFDYNNGHIIISELEIYSHENNYTIDTVNKIRVEYPNDKLFLLVGTDMYNTLDIWKDSKRLLEEVTAVELPRSVIPISSSELREMLSQRKGREYIEDSNYALIIKNKLYNAKPDWDWLRQQAYSMLDPLRIPHVVACEKEARRLAEYWGVDADDAGEAAILHDITKKLDFSENLCIISEHGPTINEFGKNEEKLLHSITGALIAQSEYGVSDHVAEAIKWHTTGKADMTMLEKIIYIADYIEETRSFPEVDQLRKLAYKNINEAMLLGLEMTVSDLKSRNIPPNIATIEAINDYKNIISLHE
ncbi:MAG: bis(5'-nucleosyl)-tetraphosphatase (symmetrical) YqeK [Oscillospiraceae bacterium]|nr:bis(5'-nucleosyl)-tetraphosphatase (symmetrical) YqeK [Oscillospiraceae bacterium]